MLQVRSMKSHSQVSRIPIDLLVKYGSVISHPIPYIYIYIHVHTFGPCGITILCPLWHPLAIHCRCVTRFVLQAVTPDAKRAQAPWGRWSADKDDIHGRWNTHIGMALSENWDFLHLAYWCYFRREFSGMIHWLTINVIIPATPSNPSSNPT